VVPIHPTSVHWIIRFVCNTEVLSQAATQAEFENALQLIWSALPQKGIDIAVKDYSKRL